MNVEKLRELQKFIQIEPRRFTMSTGLTKFDPNYHYSGGIFTENTDLFEMPPCQTAACLAGEAVLMVRSDAESTQWHNLKSEAMDILGLTYSQAHRLFFFNDEYAELEPDKPFAFDYYKAKTPQERVQVAVAFIDHFIQTETESEERMKASDATATNNLEQ